MLCKIKQKNNEHLKELFIGASSLTAALNKRTIVFIYTIFLVLIDGNMEKYLSEKTFSRNEASLRDRKRKLGCKNKNVVRTFFDRNSMFI